MTSFILKNQHIYNHCSHECTVKLGMCWSFICLFVCFLLSYFNYFDLCSTFEKQTKFYFISNTNDQHIHSLTVPTFAIFNLKKFKTILID